ncbi:MAG: regulatory helix-turn-helix protein AraC family [Chitinophagaceae bacterium]|nr:MAG: regulatory helix-turn-helix protein AraC family [Chitinophagaceae bacterium]
MYFNFNWRSGLLLIFFVHGLVYAFLLLNKGLKKESNSDIWLSAFLFLSVLYICPWMLGYAGWYNGLECLSCRNFMFYMPMSHTLLMGPVIFFYIQQLLNPGFTFSKKDYLHFIPGALYILWNLIVAIVDGLIKQDYYLMDGQNDPDFADWYIGFGLISLLFYLVLSLKYYKNYLAFIVEELSFADTVQYVWVRNFLIACFIYFFSTLLLDLLNLFGFDIEYTTTWWYYLLFALLFYYIAITGYAHSIEQKKQYSLDFLRYKMPYLLGNVQPTELVIQEEGTTNVQEQVNPDQTEIPAIWKTKLIDAMEVQKMYRDAELTLTDLATHLGTNASILSNVINRSFCMNFNDFVNQYRVNEVKAKLADQANAQFTIMSIAYDAGFNSKATFNRAFKKHTGAIPTKYQIK